MKVGVIMSGNKTNYYIGIDSQGGVYLEHVGFGKSTKYLQKIKDGAKTRYFYTKEQLDAYYNKGKEKVKDWAGADEKARRDAARQNVRDAERKGRNAYRKDQAAFEEYERVRSGGREGRGLSEEQYRKHADKTLAAKDKAYKNYEKAKSDAYQAEREYDKTLMGRVDGAKKTVQDAKSRKAERAKQKERAERDKNSDNITIANNHLKDVLEDTKRPTGEKATSYKHGMVWPEQQFYDNAVKEAQDYLDRINEYSKYGQPTNYEMQELERRLDEIRKHSAD